MTQETPIQRPLFADENTFQPYLMPPVEGEGEAFYTESGLFYELISLYRPDFATGLPCGELRDFIRECAQNSNIVHAPTTNEREAVGMAAGAWLGGKRPVLYMQNSGMFVASNDIGSLLLPYRIPMVMVTSWRGAPGETAAQHAATGKATTQTLDALGVSHVEEPTRRNLDQLVKSLEASGQPVCILEKKAAFNTDPGYPTRPVSFREQGEYVDRRGSITLNRERVLAIISSELREQIPTISSTGLISRSMYEHFDAENQFYNTGGFGLTSTIGLGLSIARPDLRVAVIEGDGSVLTDIGNLNLIGHYQPKGFIHIVLDNESYGSCSGEPTPGSSAIPQLAADLGYKTVYTVSSESDIRKCLRHIVQDQNGPHMLHVTINAEGRRDLLRPPELSNIARRFKQYVLSL